MAGFQRIRIWVLVAVVWVAAFLYLRHSGAGISFQRPAGDAASQQPTPKPKKSWTRRPPKYPVEAQSVAEFPPKRPGVKIPQIQAHAPAEDADAKQLRLARLAAVKESFEHSWTGYVDNAWMHDELTPYSGKYKDPLAGWGATLVGSLDTLWIMGMKMDFEKAAAAVGTIDFTRTKNPSINTYETNARYLGGLLGAYEISNRKYPVLLTKAIEVGDLLMCAFDTPNRMPISRWQWRLYAGGAEQVAHQQELVAEIGSFSLEFTKLSQLTGDMKYYDAAKRVSDRFELTQLDTRLPGMWPVVVDALTPALDLGSDFSLGDMSDSVYEYLPKQYLMLGGLLEQPRHLYENFINTAKRHLFYRAQTPFGTSVVVPVDLHVNDAPTEKKPKFNPIFKMQHASCFAGGMVGLASRVFGRPEEMALATQLTDGCVWAYNATKAGIAPEAFTFIPCAGCLDQSSEAAKNCAWSGAAWLKAVEQENPTEFAKPADPPEKWVKPSVQQFIDRVAMPKGMTAINDARYNLRPEAIESVFTMYRLTGDAAWMEKAWVMFTHIEDATRSEIASSAIDDVLKKQPVKLDNMDSFWMAQTLKYFYLIFSEFDVVSLDKWVLNTEAHPLKRTLG